MESGVVNRTAGQNPKKAYTKPQFIKLSVSNTKSGLNLSDKENPHFHPPVS